MRNWISHKLHWNKVYRDLKFFLNDIQQEKILLYGYPKSGNTWLRFFLFNYRSLMLNPKLNETLDYTQLNTLQNNILDRGTTYMPVQGMPVLYRTHQLHFKTFKLFDKKIFVHRNPLDTLISAYYFYGQRKLPFPDDNSKIRSKLHEIDFYVKYKLDDWITFYRKSVQQADFKMNYSQMMKDPELIFSNLIIYLNWDFDSDLIKKSIELSSFTNIKKMSIFKKQFYGNGPTDGSFKGEFTRSGVESQFFGELEKETINFVINRFPEFIKLYPDLIE